MTDIPSWIDTHCHLEMLKQGTDKVLKTSQESGMRFCITIGTSHEANLRVKELCRDYQSVYGTLGFHPHDASRVEADHLQWIREELDSNLKMIAVGECGYDLFYEHSKKEDQTKIFETQLELASELNLPVVIHSRDADRETREMLNAFKDSDLSGVVHCFTSDLEQARFILDYGFSLSFNGICTFPQAEAVREVLQYTPLDRLLLETDSPYLSPVPFRGKPNIPGRVSIVGEFIADFLGISTENLANQVMENTKTLFPRIDYEN
jgi:TatD DNase family protein